MKIAKFLLFHLFFNSISWSTLMPKIQNIKTDTEFTYENILLGYFYITPTINKTDFPELDNFEIYIEKSLKKERKKFKFFDTISTLAIINKDKRKVEYDRVRESYANCESIEPDKIKKISSILNETGYIIFSRIESFNVWDDEKEKESYIVNPKTNEGEFVTDIIYSREVAMGGVLTIFCLKTGKIVFEAKHRIIKSGKMFERKDGDCLTSLFDDLSGDYFDFRPDVSDPGVFGEQLFNEIISNLPNKT